MVVNSNCSEGRLASMKTYFTAKIIKTEKLVQEKLSSMKQNINSRNWPLYLAHDKRGISN